MRGASTTQAAGGTQPRPPGGPRVRPAPAYGPLRVGAGHASPTGRADAPATLTIRPEKALIIGAVGLLSSPACPN